MKNLSTHVRAVKLLLLTVSLSTFISVNAQQYTESFASAPVFTPYSAYPAWIEKATITLGGTAYDLSNGVNGGWQFVTTGGVGNSGNLFYNTAADTYVKIQRQDGKRFQFYGAWLKYTNSNASLYGPPWLKVAYGGSTMPNDTLGNNTTVILNKNVNVSLVTISFSGLLTLNFDNVILGPPAPVAPFPATSNISIYSNTSATLGGSVSDDGSGTVTESGMVYSTSPNPTIADNKLALSSGLSSFSGTVTGLQSGVTYYVRSYATNSAGTGYGPVKTFTTFGTFTAAGVHNFNTSWASTSSQASPFTKYVEGWDATGLSTGAGLISVNRLTTTNAGEGVSSLRVASSTTLEDLVYMSMRTNDGSLFKLQSFIFRYSVKSVATSFGTLTVTGYKNHVAVPGAVQNILNVAAVSGVTAYTSFTAAGNIFDNIDEFRLTASNSPNAARLASFDIDAITTTSSTLPVTFTSVKAFQKNSGIQVSWDVATESNVKYYEIEKSPGGQNFTKSGEVSPTANNFSSAKYTWFDPNVISGTGYYRIKTVFNDGSNSLSQIVKVSIGTGKPAISVYPNPLRGAFMTLLMNNQPKGSYKVELYNNSGQKIYRTAIEHGGGSSTQTIPINSLSKGIYQVKVSSVSKQFIQKIVVE